MNGSERDCRAEGVVGVDVRAEDLEELGRVTAANAVRSAALRGLVVTLLTRRGSA
jgi:hypothetical protein